MGSALSVKDADERFAALAVHVVELREELAACFATAPDSAQMDGLLARARDLLEVLDEDRKKIEGDLGPEYDVSGFQTLTDQVHQVMDSVTSIPLIYLYDDLVRRLPQGWQAVRGNGGHVWFRGTSIDNALTVLNAGHFDCTYTRTGAYFGKGTYFTPTYAVAEKYGECVFGMNNPGDNILRVRQVKQQPTASSVAASLTSNAPFVAQQRILDLVLEVELDYDATRRIRDSANAGMTLTRIAKEQGYDAVEFLESDEGHILVVLKDLPCTAADVVFIRVFK
jgi:hypothetical protein